MTIVVATRFPFTACNLLVPGRLLDESFGITASRLRETHWYDRQQLHANLRPLLTIELPESHAFSICSRQFGRKRNARLKQFVVLIFNTWNASAENAWSFVSMPQQIIRLGNSSNAVSFVPFNADLHLQIHIWKNVHGAAVYEARAEVCATLIFGNMCTVPQK